MITRESPKNLQKGDENLFASEQSVSITTYCSHTFSNVFVDVDGLIFSTIKIKQECLVWDTHKKIYNSLYVLKRRIKSNVTKLDKNKHAIICFDYWSDGYFHWIVEALPRLLMAHTNGLFLSTANVLLLPSRFKNKFQEASLKIIGNFEIKWIEQNEIVKCKKATIVSRTATSGSNNPAIIQQLRGKIFERYPIITTPKKRIYISRAKANRRKVINEAQLLPVLVKYGFEVIYFEDYTFEEQIVIAKEMEFCISIHGANLTNLLFMQEGANILELRMKADAVNNYYYALADASKINYYYQQCNFMMHTETGNAFDLEVDVSLLENNIKLMIDTAQNKNS